MSEEEIQKQAEKDELYKIKKTIQQIDMHRYNSLKSKEQKEDDKLERFIEDLNQEKKIKRQDTDKG